MSKIALTPNVSGTGTLTLAAPNTNTDRTLTLPDATGTAVINKGSEIFNIDVAGNLGMGTTSPVGAGLTLNLQGSTSSTYSSIVAGSTSNANFVSLYSGQTVDPNPSIVYNNSLRIGSATSPNTSGYVERMRIDASGNLLVGKTSPTNDVTTAGTLILPNGKGVFTTTGATQTLVVAKNSSTSGSLIDFYYNGSVVGSATTSGTTTAYNTSSDYRLKENVHPMQDALAKIAQLNPVTYTWKADGSDGQGFIAHELQAVVPDCVSGEKDAVDADGKPQYQGVDTSFLVATLVKAIQELTARIAVLEAK